MLRAYSLEKTLGLGKTEGKSRRGQQRMRWLGSIIDSMDMSKLQEMVKDREAWHAAVHGGHKESGTEQLLSIQSSDWTTPRDYPNPGIEPVSPSSPALAGRFFTTGPPRKPPNSILGGDECYWRILNQGSCRGSAGGSETLSLRRWYLPKDSNEGKEDCEASSGECARQRDQ